MGKHFKEVIEWFVMVSVSLLFGWLTAPEEFSNADVGLYITLILLGFVLHHSLNGKMKRRYVLLISSALSSTLVFWFLLQ